MDSGSNLSKRSSCVVVDTSILIRCAEQNIDLYGQIVELVRGRPLILVYPAVLEELEVIRSRFGGKKRAAASIALEIIRRLLEENRASLVEEGCGELPVDEFLLIKAHENGCLIATVDVELRGKARNRGIRTIFVRESKRKLEVI